MADFKKVAEQGLLNARDILENVFPAGVVNGREFCIGNTRGDRGQSLRFNLDSGIWRDFANENDKGNDIISLVAKHKGIPNGEAAEWLNGQLGAPAKRKPPEIKKEIKFLQYVTEPPRSIFHSKEGTPDILHEYRDIECRLVGFICRYEIKPGKRDKKQFYPYNPTTTGWQWRQRPITSIYGLEKLATQRPTIVCEGEKAANSAQQLMGSGYNAVAWPGGQGAPLKCDWSPIISAPSIILWADRDAVGEKAMNRLAGHLLSIGITNISTIFLPGTFDEGYDAADWLVDRRPISDIERFIAPYSTQALLEAQDGILPEEEDVPVPELEDDVVIDASVKKLDRSVPHVQGSPKNKRTFIPLGYNKGKFYYYSHKSRQVVELSPSMHTEKNFLQLDDISYFNGAYPNSKGNLDEGLATNFLYNECFNIGIYDQNRIRGRGAWWDNGKSVFHLGDRMVVDGEEQRSLSVEDSQYIYEASLPIGSIPEESLTNDEIKDLIRLMDMVRWDTPIMGRLCLGWCVLAPICGALRWRPHVWLTGAKGTGKTWVMNNIIKPLLGDIVFNVIGDTTAPGIRQDLKYDALPVLFDEAEGEEKTAQDRIQQVLFLMRQCSAETTARIVKGSAGGKSDSYLIRSSFCLSSINDSLKSDADESRVTVLSLRGQTEKGDTANEGSLRHFEQLTKLAFPLAKRDYSRRLLARTIRLIPTIRKNVEIFREAAILERSDARAGDQIGTLLAAAFSLYSTREVTIDEARGWVKEKEVDRFVAESDASYSRPFDFLAQQICHVRKTTSMINATAERTMGQLMLIAAGLKTDEMLTDTDAADYIIRRGIRVEGKSVLIANKHDQLKKIFEYTQWGLSWASAMKKMPGAEGAENRPYSFTGTKSRVTRINLEAHMADLVD